MQRLIALASAAFLGAGLIASAQAHIGGHKLDETQCRAAWAMASAKGAPLDQNRAEIYVVNVIIVDDNGDGMVSEEEFKSACAGGLMSDAAVTMAEECSDTHITQMHDMVANMSDAAKRNDAISHLDMSKAALDKGDIMECLKNMIEAHKDMGM
jgi:hypothetical protein